MAKEETKTAGTNEAAGVVKGWTEEKAAQSAENRYKGGEDVKTSLVNKVSVEFTKDFGKHLKKGDKMEVSEQAFDIYNAKGVIKKL